MQSAGEIPDRGLQEARERLANTSHPTGPQVPLTGESAVSPPTRKEPMKPGLRFWEVARIGLLVVIGTDLVLVPQGPADGTEATGVSSLE